MYIPDYMLFKIVSIKKEQSNILNGNAYKDEDDLLLQLVFDQCLILKTIVLEVFLNEYEENKYIRNNIINQVKAYYSNNIVDINNKKIQLLISVIKENMKENLEFKEKFLESIQK